jgi:hypothetical protein
MSAASVRKKLEGEKARNEYKKSMPGYQKYLQAARKRVKDDMYTTPELMDAQKMVKEAVSSGGNLGNLSAKKEATLGRAKMVEKKAALKKAAEKAKKAKAPKPPYGNPVE